ncbi:MAG: TraX protein [Parasporobacterium sp.]|nr:TraX protein [Parasporobacterium sp.]
MIPEKYKVFSGSALKLIAVITMIIDHTASALIPQDGYVLLSLFGHRLTLYALMRAIGRLSFPLFGFLIVEGFIHTRDRKRYGISLFLLALISEIPWNLRHTGKLTCSTQNVMFTLLLGFLGLCVMERYREQKKTQLILMLALLVISLVIKADYGVRGFGFILMFYLLREYRIAQAVVGVCILSGTWKAGLAFVPINLYNGKRGFINNRVLKYLFYAIYPVHLLIIFVIRKHITG